MLSQALFLLVVTPVLVVAQISTPATVLNPSSVTSVVPTATGSGEPCAQVSSLLDAAAATGTSGTTFLPAQIAYDCSRSVPIHQDDALRLIDGLFAFMQWQSTLAYLKDPPSDYPFPAVDVLGGLEDLKNQVQSGAFTNEVDFQTNLTNLLDSTRDGHVAFQSDALNVFDYVGVELGPLVSVSQDGSALPQVYAFLDLSKAENGDTSFTASPISKINGEDPVTYLTGYVNNSPIIRLQDLDASYNALFTEIAGYMEGNGQYYARSGQYPFLGPSTDVAFENGTEQTYSNIAIVNPIYNFSGVDSGDSYYQKFCNATNKMAAGSASGGSSAGDKIKAATTPAKPRPSNFPSPVVITDDFNVAGYFLDSPGYETTAVLSILSFEADPIAVQTLLSNFLAACKNSSMTKLVIDVSANPGGTFIEAYDFFKQLFPNIEPYGATNFRATPEFNLLGSLIDSTSQSQLPNITAFANDYGYSFFDQQEYDDATGQPFPSWQEFFGPQQIHGDNYTYISRLNLSDPNLDASLGDPNYVVSGYGDLSSLPPQVFAAEDIILFGDGQCSSTCPIFAHFMKWQGKVKSVVAGGRPQTGPMQLMGGVKGTNVLPLTYLLGIVDYAFQIATDEQQAEANKTTLPALYQDGEYVLYRSTDPTGTDAVSVNVRNNIAEGDDTQTPLQFVYEAADCRIWWTPDMLFNITNVWARVASVAWPGNGTAPLSEGAGCVTGSTGDPSSLSGNTKLFANGVADNVTEPANAAGENPSSAVPSSTSGGSTATGTGAGAASGTATASSAAVVGVEKAGLGALAMGVAVAAAWM